MPRLLFLTPIRPLLSGSGLGMRAGLLVEALAKDFDVSVVVVPVVGEPSCAVPVPLPVVPQIVTVAESVQYRRLLEIDDPQRRLARAAMYPHPALFRFATPEAIARVAALAGNRTFDVVLVFRLYMTPFAESPAFRSMRRWLDLDESESRAHFRVAELLERTGNPVAASLERTEATKYSRAEQQHLPLFDRVFVCSDLERHELSAAHPQATIAIVPNGIRFPPNPSPPTPGAVFRMLFTGSLGYFPNEDAAVFFCREILPSVKRASNRRSLVVIAGSRPTSIVRNLACNDDVLVAGDVPDMEAQYRTTDVVVVPLRAGGGTRIKILEAFAHRRPVVSTPFGAEGLEVTDGNQLLLADAPEEFARRCMSLAEDPAAARQLADRAYEWVRARHGIDAVRSALRAGS
jgi:glycosyltransferase involved in cell wall biosynthesis